MSKAQFEKLRKDHFYLIQIGRSVVHVCHFYVIFTCVILIFDVILTGEYVYFDWRIDFNRPEETYNKIQLLCTAVVGQLSVVYQVILCYHVVAESQSADHMFTGIQYSILESPGL